MGERTMEERSDGTPTFPKLPSSLDLALLKVVYVLFLLSGIVALTVAPEEVGRILPYPAAVLGLTALGVGLIAVTVTISRLRHRF